MFEPKYFACDFCRDIQRQEGQFVTTFQERGFRGHPAGSDGELGIGCRKGLSPVANEQVDAAVFLLDTFYISSPPYGRTRRGRRG